MPPIPQWTPDPTRPGSPRGRDAYASGRRQALRVLDRVLAKAEVKRALDDALTEHALNNPIAFLTKVVMPVLPREAFLEIGGDLPIRVISPIPHPEARSLAAAAVDVVRAGVAALPGPAAELLPAETAGGDAEDCVPGEADGVPGAADPPPDSADCPRPPEHPGA